MAIETNDLFLLYRDDGTHRKVTTEDLKGFILSATGEIDGGFAPDTQTIDLDGGNSG